VELRFRGSGVGREGSTKEGIGKEEEDGAEEGFFYHPETQEHFRAPVSRGRKRRSDRCVQNDGRRKDEACDGSFLGRVRADGLKRLRTEARLYIRTSWIEGLVGLFPRGAGWGGVMIRGIAG
jgi:hypothetical protein